MLTAFQRGYNRRMQFLIAAAIAILYGLVEGITEWLPISSTGHMILLSAITGLDIAQRENQAFFSLFLVVIQLGAILAICVYFFKSLVPFFHQAGKERRAIWMDWLKILVGCLPAGVCGVLLKVLPDSVDSALNSPYVIGSMLALYGVAFIVCERILRVRESKLQAAGSSHFRYTTIEEVPLLTCFYVGLIQILSLIPGTSRSGVTILAGLLLAISRPAAARFSFYLSIPLMLGASIVEGAGFFMDGNAISATGWTYLGVGVLSAFLVSLVAVRFLLKFIEKHTFEGFGYYRILVGALVIGLAAGGLM